MKVSLYMAMTLNGYIARGDHSIAWTDAEWQEYAKALKDAGAYIVGRTTYEMMVKDNEFEKIGNPAVCVLTGGKKDDQGAVMFASMPEEALSKLEARGFTKVIVGGGAQCNAAFLKAGVVDEVIVDIEPLMFGSGIPLFSTCALDVPLELIDVRQFGGGELQLRYKVVRSGL